MIPSLTTYKPQPDGGQGLKCEEREDEDCLEWDSNAIKEVCRQRYTDTAEDIRRSELSQDDLDKEWSKLADDVEVEVLTKYRVHKDHCSNGRGRGKPMQWIYKKKVRQVQPKARDSEDWSVWRSCWSIFLAFGQGGQAGG